MGGINFDRYIMKVFTNYVHASIQPTLYDLYDDFRTNTSLLIMRKLFSFFAMEIQQEPGKPHMGLLLTFYNIFKWFLFQTYMASSRVIITFEALIISRQLFFFNTGFEAHNCSTHVSIITYTHSSQSQLND